MRFIEYVPCGRYSLRTIKEEDDQPRGHVITVEGRAEGRNLEGATWRPSLGSISEDAAVLIKNKVAEGRRRSKHEKRTPATRIKSSGIDRNIRVHRSDRDDLRHFDVPAFAPAAFLF